MTQEKGKIETVFFSNLKVSFGLNLQSVFINCSLPSLTVYETPQSIEAALSDVFTSSWAFRDKVHIWILTPKGGPPNCRAPKQTNCLPAERAIVVRSQSSVEAKDSISQGSKTQQHSLAACWCGTSKNPKSASPSMQHKRVSKTVWFSVFTSNRNLPPARIAWQYCQ